MHKNTKKLLISHQLSVRRGGSAVSPLPQRFAKKTINTNSQSGKIITNTLFCTKTDIFARCR